MSCKPIVSSADDSPCFSVPATKSVQQISGFFLRVSRSCPGGAAIAQTVPLRVSAEETRVSKKANDGDRNRRHRIHFRARANAAEDTLGTSRFHYADNSAPNRAVRACRISNRYAPSLQRVQ